MTDLVPLFAFTQHYAADQVEIKLTGSNVDLVVTVFKDAVKTDINLTVERTWVY